MRKSQKTVFVWELVCVESQVIRVSPDAKVGSCAQSRRDFLRVFPTGKCMDPVSLESPCVTLTRVRGN